MPTGAQAAKSWAGASAELYSPMTVPIAAGQPSMTNQGQQQTVVLIAIDMSDHSDYAFDRKYILFSKML
jgi:hypothetical protein